MRLRKRPQQSIIALCLMSASLLILCTHTGFAAGRRGGGEEDKPPVESLLFKALTDFPDINAGEVPYYQDNSRQALAINAANLDYREKFARAVRSFAGPSGVFNVAITTVIEEDGESTFRLLVNGEIVATFQNPYIGPGGERNNQPHRHLWRNITLMAGDELAVESDTHSNGELPEPGGFAWARGRWRQIALQIVERFPVSHLPFEGDLTDTVGHPTDPNGLMGLDANSLPVFEPGVNGLGIVFDGSNYADLGADYGNAVIAPLAHFTASVWVNATNTGGWSRIFEAGADRDNRVALLAYSGGTPDEPAWTGMGGPRLEVRINGEQHNQNAPASAITDGEWTHLAMVLDAAENEAKIYANGVLTESRMGIGQEFRHAKAFTNDPSKIADPFTYAFVGNSDDGNLLTGAVDELKIYNAPLRPGDVAKLAQVGGDLVHHWGFDEDTSAGDTIAVDSVGDANGVINNTVSAAGVYGNALDFHGSGTQVDVAEFSTAGLKRMTCTMWMNPAEGLTTAPAYKRVFSSGDHWEIVMQPGTGELGNNFYRKGGVYPKCTLPPVEGEWTHVAMTSELLSEGTGLMTIYINGELDAWAPGLAKDDWNGGLLLIGNRPGKQDPDRYKGLMDDVRIYNDVLTPSQIIAAMNGE